MAAGAEGPCGAHGARWALPLRPPLCLACAVETLGDGSASLVRKKHVLSRLQDALAWQALPVVQLLAPDERVCMHLIGTLFGMLHTVEDSGALDLLVEVLVRLVVELKSEQYLCSILNESQKELCKGTMRSSLPTFTLLGKLADAVPGFADLLVVEHSNFVDHLLMGLLYPNEGIKAAVCYLYGKLYSSPVGTGRLSTHFEERLCSLFLNTLGCAQTKELQVNCLGLLKELLKSDHFVSILMNNSKLEEETESPDFVEGENPLPLVLKKLLLTRDEILQAASSHCVAAVLVQSPSRYAPAFIHADVPEFLFECLLCKNEILIWSVYCCLLLLTEERLFFSKCHTVYGIESLVRSLQDVLQMNNVVLHKQGLLLFTEILKRQPVEIKLFTNQGVCIKAIDVLMETVNCPVLEVAVEAVRAVAAFLRKDHLSSPPVPYELLQKLLEAVLKRCADLSPPQSSKRHAGDLFSVSQNHPANRSHGRVPHRQGQFLLNTLESFRNACRLAVEFQGDFMAQENAFTAPNSESKDTLSNFSEFLLRICDRLCIPMVMSYLQRAVSVSVAEVFISTLNILFTVVPNMRNKFSKKLASSSFIQLTLELKARFCSVQSNPVLNQTCSSFLCSLCLNLYSATEKRRTSQEEQEMSDLLQKGLPQLNYTIAESLLLLSETPEPFCLDQSLCSHQHCFILLLYFAYTLGDRFVPDAELFRAVRNFLLSAQDSADCPPPHILRAALYLLAVCQDKGEALDLRSLCTIRRILDNLPDLSLVYVHCPLLLKFFLRYPELMGRFGHQVLQLWFSWEDCKQTEAEEPGFGMSDQLKSDSPLLPILKSNSSILLILLDLVCSSSEEVAWKVLMTLRTFLERNEDVLVCDLLRSRFLQILQQLLVESSSATLQANRNLPVLLSLLFLVQMQSKGMRELDSTDFKLLHQVSNLCGKCRPRDTGLLQPSLNFLYWSLHQTTPCSQQRAVAVLLSNVSLLELLQKVLECTWLQSSPSGPAYLSSEDALLCSGWLLVASLLLYQHRYNTEVHQTLSLDLKEVLNAVIFRNKKPILLLVSIMQFLRAALRQNFSSSLLVMVGQNTEQGATQPQPSSLQDAALHPLATQQVFSLVVSLQNLLVHVQLQKDLLLSQAVVACLETLVEYLYVKNQDVALHVVSQPWHQFLLFTLLNGGQKSLLQPEVLRLMTLGEAWLVPFSYQTTDLRGETTAYRDAMEEASAANMDFFFICPFLLMLLLSWGSFADLEQQRVDSGLEIYKKLFEVKRKDQMNALKNLIELNDVNQQYKIIDIMLKGLFKVLEDSRAVLIAADVPPDGPFPQDEKIKDAYSHVVENTAFFGDVVLRFPKIVHHYFDRNSNWNNLIRWGIGFCNLTGVFEQGPHSQVLRLMAQELGISEKSPDYRNPFKTDHSEFFPSADTFQKALRDEEKRRKKEEKRKEIRKGPRISRSQSEL
ncbi:meiosis inhibitor protein 1-like isoform X1 [Pithys albifrons albifrons]|uniref:meiosis inhibitor protein 1-like isoform X1 n=1 Tax=Pithys albifrons albifrons TaxID=3385563 RepID=UPI003A5D2128